MTDDFDASLFGQQSQVVAKKNRLMFGTLEKSTDYLNSYEIEKIVRIHLNF